MRKISKITSHAFMCGESMTLSNTTVSNDGELTNLYLHGNLIATRKENVITVRTAGWDTPTTKERLNSLPGVSVYTSKGQLYLNGEKWDGKDKDVTIV